MVLGGFFANSVYLSLDLRAWYVGLEIGVVKQKRELLSLGTWSLEDGIRGWKRIQRATCEL